MGNKIRVYGKAQNRTALGIMHAYLIMHPHATLEDLKKAFYQGVNQFLDDVGRIIQDIGNAINNLF